MRAALLSLYDVENTAVRQIARYLRVRGHEAVEVYFKDWRNNSLDWPTDAELGALIDLLRREGVGAVGISLRASAYLRVCIHLTHAIREALGIPVIWGGIHPTLNPEDSVVLTDYVVVGEGEDALAELLDRLEARAPTTDVANVWTRRDGTVHRNAVRPLLQDLTQVTERDFLHPDKAWIEGGRVDRRDPLLMDPAYLVFASRGCVFRCSFCYHSTLRGMFQHKGAYYRYRPVEHVIAELRRARDLFPNMKRVRFDDEVFVPERRWVREFARRYPDEVGLPFECFIEPRLVDEERMTLLRGAGLDVVHMGIQAADRVSADLYDRPSDRETILEAGRLFHRLGIVPRYLVIVDDPMSGAEDRRELLDMMLELPRPFDVYLFSLTVFPGTSLAHKLLESGVIGPDQVEGPATKTFEQYRVDLAWARPDEEKLWISLLVLANKPFVPQALVRRMAASPALVPRAAAVARGAQAANMVNMALRIPTMYRRGEIGPRVLRRFWNARSFVTH
ncbi:cobalamin-dependent protein [Myxococcota bacterium]|nr:cobalamin-dependent protein [Myxococcota bacterium]